MFFLCRVHVLRFLSLEEMQSLEGALPPPPPTAHSLAEHVKLGDDTDSAASATQDSQQLTETDMKRKKKLELNRIASRVRMTHGLPTPECPVVYSPELWIM